MTFSTKTPEQTKELAARFASTLQGGELLALEGELGSGKTTFVQGLGEALETNASVRSPSFTLMNVYPTNHPTIKFLVHLDCYRLGPSCSLEQLELEEWLERPDVVIAIEWPPDHLPAKETSFCITFKMNDDRTRNLSFFPEPPSLQKA